MSCTTDCNGVLYACILAAYRVNSRRDERSYGKRPWSSRPSFQDGRALLLTVYTILSESQARVNAVAGCWVSNTWDCSHSGGK